MNSTKYTLPEAGKRGEMVKYGVHDALRGTFRALPLLDRGDMLKLRVHLVMTLTWELL